MKKAFSIIVVMIMLLACLTSCTRSVEEQWQEQYDLGIRYLSEGNYEEAIIAFEAAIEIDPLAVDGYMMLADAYIAIDEPEQAAQVLYSGWQNCPDDAQTFLDRLEQIGYIIDEDGALISVEGLEVAAFSAYQEILDLIYYGIINQWAGVETGATAGSIDRITYLWYLFPVESLSDAGYMLVDLNDDHTPELLTSVATAAEGNGSAGMIYDLYTIIDGAAVHVISSGERDRYYLCADQFIANEGSSGAADSIYRFYDLQQNSSSLHLIELVRYYGMDNPANPWFYGTTDTYDVDGATQISEAEAWDTINSYTHIPLTLTLFDAYVPATLHESEPLATPEVAQHESTPPISSAPNIETPVVHELLPVDFVGMTVSELSAIYGADFVYADYWLNGMAKPIYYSDFRLPLIFYYLDPEYQSNASGDEEIIIVEYTPSEDTLFSEIAPGIPTNVTYRQLLDEGYTGTFFDEDAGMWMQEMGETSQFTFQYDSNTSMIFYWFDHADPYTEPAGQIQITGG